MSATRSGPLAREGVGFLFKQWGEWAPFDQLTTESRAVLEAEAMKPGVRSVTAGAFPDGTQIARYGKRYTGRALDGATHDAGPRGAT